MRKFIGVCWIATLLTTAAAHPARADERDDYRNMIDQQKKQQAMYINRLDLLPGRKRIDEIVRVAIEDGKLVIKSPLFSSETAAKLRNRQVRAEIEGFEGYCTIMVQPINNGFYFTFSNVQYPKLEGVTNLTISMQPGHLQISKNYNSRSKNYNVNLMQSSGRGVFGQPDGVQFSVYGGDNTGRMGTSVNLSEPDFVTLRRKHPREVNEHLRPLLRDLRLENVFAVDATTAWQVFADEWKGNPELTAQVKALLPALEVDGYPQREAARLEMHKLGPEAALAIYRMGREGLSPEQNCQLDAVMAAHSFLSRAEAARLINDVDFLLDCLYSDDDGIRETAVKHLHQATKREFVFDTRGDYDTRVTRVETLRSELQRPPTTRAAKG